LLSVLGRWHAVGEGDGERGPHGIRRDGEQRWRGRILGIHDLDLVVLT